jgi:hypothetical protein
LVHLFCHQTIGTRVISKLYSTDLSKGVLFNNTGFDDYEKMDNGQYTVLHSLQKTLNINTSLEGKKKLTMR